MSRMGQAGNGIKKRNNRAGFIFLLPLIIIFIGLLGYSFYFLIVNSFKHVTITFRNTDFVGLSNYSTILADKTFWRALFNTFLLSAANIFCGLTFGFFISIILNFKIKGKRFFHALFFVPSMLPIALMAAVFSSMLEYKNGIVNQLLRGAGLGALAQRWLADPNLAIWSVCSVSIFLIGIPIMYYTADMTTISDSVLEAATMDGAKMRHQLFMVIYPMLKNTHKTIILSMLLGGFREMERVFMMTDGGPGGATEIIGTYIYRATRSAGSNIGLVCAAAIIVLIVAFLISFIQLKLTEKNA
ncbi:sugar ABC transporter permease [Clostridium sp. AF19-22AC]|jgi:raffinose/stachyose/melibiose transport system permease protein|uniref:carbohydrate ABC transporter permease n=1 Tax=Clostridia TaxID=186801 RepID=UPI000E4E68D2|nr:MULTISPECIES: sugar ABC transporter permease [Clostridia]RHR33188.1 sugar ABC transporter permease [Clostridium sp. AF19-22AC]